MAITLADFTKIWASTSPLTPYTFTDANYQQGWNFVGATPPARQMWDSIQKQNDEKLKYVVDNYLPTAGGTMTGAIKYAGDNSEEFSLGLSSATNVDFGWDYDNRNGATIGLRSNGDTNSGEFEIFARNASNSVSLNGKPDGTLTWNGGEVLAKATNVRVGKTSVTTVNANSNTNVSVSFSPAFSSVPIVLATINTGYTGVFASVGSLSESGCNILITNVSNTNRSVIVGWVAISL